MRDFLKVINYTYTILLSLFVIVFVLDLCMSMQNPQEYKYSSDSYSSYVIKSIGTIAIYLLLLVISVLRLRNSKNKTINAIYYIGLVLFVCTITYNIYQWRVTGFDH
jgi:cell division protein FtsW (lipid II flippase)